MIRKLRLASGLLLFAFVVTHLLNHALGLLSISAMQAGLALFTALWRSPPGTLLLYGGLLLHFGLALRALYRHRRLPPPAEAAQLLLGLSIPPLIALHVAGTRGVSEFFGVQADYPYILAIFFEFAPFNGILQAVAACVVWLHVVVGLHLWLRFKPWYPQWQPWLFAAVLLLPVLALLGVWTAGREVAVRIQDPEWGPAARVLADTANTAAARFAYGFRETFLMFYAAALVAVLLVRPLRRWWEHRHGRVRVLYPDGKRVAIPVGLTILEASRIGGIAHASLCGGRGRCSTCRVRVGSGLERLPTPSEGESRVLARVGAAPNVRLACQTRPLEDVEVTPLLPPNVSLSQTRRRAAHSQGQEREVVVLFADLRNFTEFAERKLPYDVVFILNRYFSAMGAAIEDAGGRIDKFIGDGVMALFGVEGTAEQGCQQALQAARAMGARLDELNRSLAEELQQPLRMGIGIHVGPAIVGEIGYGEATSLTAVGDTVNAASRLEAMTKEVDALLVVSRRVTELGGVQIADARAHEVAVRGRRDALAVLVVKDLHSIGA